jgi:hypothetical protein
MATAWFSYEGAPIRSWISGRETLATGALGRGNWPSFETLVPVWSRPASPTGHELGR